MSSTRSDPHSPMQHRAGWALLTAVTLAHLLAANELATDRYGWGAGSKPIARIDVSFVRELQQAAPPERAAATEPAAPAAGRALPSLASAAASAPASAAASAPASAAASAPASAPSQSVAATIQAPPVVAEPVPTPPAVPADVRPAAAASADQVPTKPAQALQADASSATADKATPPPATAAFDWPPSTRMTYSLTGDYRGPVQGTARVEWLRSGTRYQVQLEAKAALILTRRTTSEGELTDRGLVPQRFEGEQSVLMRTRRWAQQFLADRVVLANGSEVPMQAGAQDEASQFVQLTWLFTTQPQLLQVGQSIDIPLVVNSRLDRWTYDVAEQQTLQLPFGAVETFHVKSRREAKGNDLTPEIWIAPSLQYLPVRILLRQGTSGHVDLVLDKPPLQANR